MIALVVARREWGSFFRTSSGWVIIALYLLLSGFWFAFGALEPGAPATLRAFFGVSQWILLIVGPAISMRLIADERRSGTIESLSTAPVSDWEVVIGKYAGAVGFLLTMLSPTLLYVLLLEAVSDPDYGPIVAGYVGLLLVGMLYLSAGTLFSALTENQVVALLATVFFFLVLELVAVQGGRMLGPPWDTRLFALSVLLRVGDLSKGVIDSAHVAAFVGASAWFLVLAVAALEWRRWR